MFPIHPVLSIFTPLHHRPSLLHLFSTSIQPFSHMSQCGSDRLVLDDTRDWSLPTQALLHTTTLLMAILETAGEVPQGLLPQRIKRVINHSVEGCEAGRASGGGAMLPLQSLCIHGRLLGDFWCLKIWSIIPPTHIQICQLGKQWIQSRSTSTEDRYVAICTYRHRTAYMESCSHDRTVMWRMNSKRKSLNCHFYFD